jgi:hypothetical protein
MNSPRYEPHAATRTTHTYWPGRRRPESPSAAQPMPETSRDEKKEEEHAPDEPGYGHGV